MYRKTLLSVFSLLFFVLYLSSVAVVIMFLTSALHIVDPELFRFQRFDLLTGGITVFILVISVRAFPKLYKKYYAFLHDLFRRNRV